MNTKRIEGARRVWEVRKANAAASRRKQQTNVVSALSAPWSHEPWCLMA